MFPGSIWCCLLVIFPGNGRLPVVWMVLPLYILRAESLVRFIRISGKTCLQNWSPIQCHLNFHCFLKLSFRLMADFWAVWASWLLSCICYPDNAYPNIFFLFSFKFFSSFNGLVYPMINVTCIEEYNWMRNNFDYIYIPNTISCHKNK